MKYVYVDGDDGERYSMNCQICDKYKRTYPLIDIKQRINVGNICKDCYLEGKFTKLEG